MLIRTSLFRTPFPRRFIVRLHRDLFRIEKRASFGVEYPQDFSLVEKMVLVSEDRRFFRHNGIDVISVVREALKCLTFRRHGGASTIDMQFVRTATGYYERTLRRKV
jgi:membrane peptidoglycan carboxypeptidase